MQSGKIFDLLVIGGGINGTGIALDAAGRGLSVILCEQNDLGSGTSSASTKLIHGGLRYLEQYDFGLVREALTEREVLLRKAPHLIRPLRFVIPYEPGLRPKWMIQLGLWIYDHLGKDCTLPRSTRLDLHKEPNYGKPLALNTDTAFAFSDCWVDDARLVIANALGAAQLGARIHPHAQVTALQPNNGIWQVNALDKITRNNYTISARSVINATGPWIKLFIENQPALRLHHQVRLVRGSHIIVPKRYEGDHAYLIQHPDGRVVFVIPYENEFTLIGTTEVATQDSPDQVKITDEEKDYLIALFNAQFDREITRDDILWEYSGVRPLVDDQGSSSSKLSRDYLLETQIMQGVPILSVYGGKITTYRTLAEAAITQLSRHFPKTLKPWTAHSTLPGGDLPEGSFDLFYGMLQQQYPWVPKFMLLRLARQYGTRIHNVLSEADSLDNLGQHFGADCYEQELQYLVDHEWARTTNDLLFRRTKLGLHLSSEAVEKIQHWLNRALRL